MELSDEACFQAVRARDGRFDGRFFVAVATTRIYCRPICPVRPPKRHNMRFFASAAAAEGAGYRPCLRCRPERAPGMAPMDAAGRLLSAAIAGIEAHALSSAKVSELAASLGVSDRHLRRVTEAALGVSPIELAQTQRLLLAKRLLRETRMTQTDIAFAAGFGSVRRFNALFKARYRMAPREARGTVPSGESLRVQMEFRPPLAWDVLLDYLRHRAIPGVEMSDAQVYRRTVSLDGRSGWIAVSLHTSGRALVLELSASLAPVIGAVIARVQQLFDLSAAPAAVAAHLGADPLLAVAVARLPGLRVAGAFEGFELAVRTVLGQQVSIKAASTLAGRWAARYGTPIATPYPELTRVSPSAAATATATEADIIALGIVGNRARALVGLATAVAEQRIVLNFAADVNAQIEALRALPGIGPWTANYIAMRALHWPDAFPSGDLMLMRAANMRRAALDQHAERWRPWRAYAAHYLWRSLSLNCPGG